MQFFVGLVKSDEFEMESGAYLKEMPISFMKEVGMKLAIISLGFQFKIHKGGKSSKRKLK